MRKKREQCVVHIYNSASVMRQYLIAHDRSPAQALCTARVLSWRGTPSISRLKTKRLAKAYLSSRTTSSNPGLLPGS